MMRASFVAPCLGVGGADMLMMELIRHTETIQWNSVIVPNKLTPDIVEYCNKYWPRKCHIHCVATCDVPDYMTAHATKEAAFKCGIFGADILITWSLIGFSELYTSTPVGIPVIEYAQNTDDYAQTVVKNNAKIATYKAACSRSAAEACWPGESDVTVIYNGINPARITPRRGRSAQRKTWGITDTAKIVLFMGRMVQEKHPEILIKTISKLPPEYIGIFCGEGLQQPQLFDMAKYFAPGRIAFVKPQYYVGDVLDVADCFFLPSDYEGHPLALMEAMLAGKHCVYSDLPVMEELEQMFGPLGEKVPIGAPVDAYVEAVLAATQETTELHFKRGNARANVWNNFCISKIANHWEEYIQACLMDNLSTKRLVPIFPVKSE